MSLPPLWLARGYGDQRSEDLEKRVSVQIAVVYYESKIRQQYFVTIADLF